MAQVAPLQERVRAAVAQRPRDALVEALLAAGVPASPVLSRAAMLALPHFRTRAVAGNAWTGHPVRFVQHPARRRFDAPDLDAHHDARFGS
jgi:crotonobetainyl-CoA:carnitine CoA-transferase CaiB-like acyl-CoA transferase